MALTGCPKDDSTTIGGTPGVNHQNLLGGAYGK